MRHRFMRALAQGAFVAISVVALTLTACGSPTTTGGSGLDIKNIIIGTDLPVVGTDAGVGLPTEYGADLAISQNKDLGSGYTLTVRNMNYSGANGPDGSIAQSNAKQFVSDSNVIAVVGPFNSGIAKVEIPIINAAGIVYISPANTNPGLTKQQYAADNGINFAQLHPADKPESYFRIPGTDDVQGKVDAQIAAAPPVNAKSVYVVDDNTTYGKGLANFFVNNFQSNGGTIAGRTSITAQQISNLPSLAATIISTHPDAVYFGGVTSGGGGALKKDLVAAGYTKAMVGGDGIADDPAWLTTAGATGALNTYGTVAAPDTSQFTSGPAATFKADYEQFVAGKPNNTLLPYSAMSYDAAMIEIQAIKNVIKAGKPVNRSTVRDQVASIQYDGVTGHISFDKNGDNAGNKVFSVYGIDASTNGQWAFKQSVNA